MIGLMKFEAYSFQSGELFYIGTAISMAEVGEDFPQLCETCLGPNPYVRMLKLPPGHKLCKISGLAYQAFKWKPAGGRQKETIISYAVAKERNICQTCLNDMQYGLPVGVRDKLLAQMGQSEALTSASQAGAAYHYKQLEDESSSSAMVGANGSYSMIVQDFSDQAPVSAAERQLAVFARARAEIEKQSSTAFRNLPKLCSFWVAGTCTRCVRKLCQFRPCAGPSTFAFPEIARTHKEMHKDIVERLKAEGPIEVMKTLSEDVRKALLNARKGYNHDDAIQDRVHGKDDLSSKYIDVLKKKKESSALTPPADVSITTLWLGNIEADVSELELRHALFPAGPVSGIHLVPKSRCAFVEYATRAEAEAAVQVLLHNLSIRGNEVSVHWAKPKVIQAPPPSIPAAAENRRSSGTTNASSTNGGVATKRKATNESEQRDTDTKKARPNSSQD